MRQVEDLFELEHLDWLDGANTDPGINMVNHSNYTCVRDNISGRVYEFHFRGTASTIGTQYNVAVKAAKQWNRSVFGGLVAHNRAEDEGTEQTNTAVCIVQ